MKRKRRSLSPEDKKRLIEEKTRIKGYIKDSKRETASKGKSERNKISMPMYWDTEAMDEVCEKWYITRAELIGIFNLYRFHVFKSMNRTSFIAPLHLQYTGYRVPGAGYFLMKKDWLVMDLLEYGVITPEQFPKWKILSRLEPKAKNKSTIIRKFINKVLKVVQPLGVKQLY